ncbi:dienelactone hydrolase family protein [Burkholderia cenocepacia]|nr:dienelactone hydrolase family protein [Burkholderia cenocepacia]
MQPSQPPAPGNRQPVSLRGPKADISKWLEHDISKKLLQTKNVDNVDYVKYTSHPPGGQRSHLLSHDSRVDPDKIMLMGFSRGGQATLYAAMTRLNRLWNTSGVRFRAYLPFYPDCMTRYRDDTDVNGPIREFHGADDDYDPAPACAAYFERLQQAGRDATMTVFPHASHAFDMPYAMPTVVVKGAQTVRACRIVENESGELMNEATGAPFSFHDDCVQTDPHVGGNAQARDAAIVDVIAYLKTVLGGGGDAPGD